MQEIAAEEIEDVLGGGGTDTVTAASPAAGILTADGIFWGSEGDKDGTDGGIFVIGFRPGHAGNGDG